MDVAGSHEHRLPRRPDRVRRATGPSVLYWVLQPGSQHRRHRPGPGPDGPPVGRVADRLGLRHQRSRRPTVDDAMATKIVHDLVGDDTRPGDDPLAPRCGATTRCTPRATASGRVFCVGDAVHRHPPSNGLGSNTSIQDSYNLAWKLADVLSRRRRARGCWTPTTTSAPRSASRSCCAPTSPSRSSAPIFDALGPRPGTERHRGDAARACDAPRRRHPEAADAARARCARRWSSRTTSSTPTASSSASATPRAPWSPTARRSRPTTATPSCTTTRRPGRAPGCRTAGSGDGGHRVSTHDLAGKGRFTLLTGITGARVGRGGARVPARRWGSRSDALVIGPGGATTPTSTTTGRGLREVAEDGCVLVRPDAHVAWRSAGLTEDPAASVTDALRTVLAR